MKQFSLKNAMITLKVLSLASIAVFGLTSCGGGSASDGDSSTTIRPKTLDGIYLRLSTNADFEFVRNTGTSAAVEDGDIETGAFFYHLVGNNRTTFPNTAGTNSDTRFPDSVSSATYTYRAINTNSAILTLHGIGFSDLNISGSFNANNASFVYLFESFSTGGVSRDVEVTLTFSNTGGVAATEISKVALVGSPSSFDEVRIPTSIRLVAGGSVPTNYNPYVDPLRDSRIAPKYLGTPNKFFDFTSTAGPTFNMTIQFQRDTGISIPNGSAYEEVGHGPLTVNGVTVIGGVDYTWGRIAGTDTGKLTLSNAGVGSTFNGEYILSFVGTNTGTYQGNADSDTVDPNEVSGTFTQY